MMLPDDPSVEFTPEEKRRLLLMLEEHERMAWLWMRAAVVAKWITTVGAGLVALKYGIIEFFKWRPLH